MNLDPRPIYVTIADDLRRQIITGELAVGDQIPTEAVLCEKHGVSRMTVRQALDSLVLSGHLRRRRGKGTFVNSAKTERSASRLLGFEEDTANRGLTPVTTVLEVTWQEADSEERQYLGLRPGTLVQKIDRLREVNGEPIGINHIVLLEPWSRALAGHDFSRSLYAILRESLVDEVKEAEQRIEAVPADAEQAALLRVEVGAPLLRIVRTTYLERHGLIGLTRTYYRGDRYFLSLKVIRDTPEAGAPPSPATAQATRRRKKDEPT